VLKAKKEGIKDKGRLPSLPNHRLSKNVYSEKKIRSVVHEIVISQKNLSV
jgi:hypothetical protein